MDSRHVVLMPGRDSGPYAPLPFYAAQAAAQRGAELHPLTWDLPGLDRASAAGEDVDRWVGVQVGAILDELADVDPDSVLVVGTSLGSRAAAVTAARGLPAVWLTPLLREPTVARSLQQATAPFLLVGGTADHEAWDGDVARDLTPHVFEVAGADHGLVVAGPPAGSIAVLGEVVTAVGAFLDAVVWPVGSV